MRPPTSETKHRLVEANLPFVRAIAARVKEHLPREIEFDELVSYGTEGLLLAAERFDGRHGASFTTYAYYRVRGAILDGLRRMGWLPRGEWARARFEERSTAYLANLAERERGALRTGPAAAGSVAEEVRELASALSGVAAIFIARMSRREAEQMQDPAPPAPEALERRQAELAVQRALAELPETEQRLIRMYYFEERTLEEVGVALGLSKSWTSRLHARAIDLLQEALRNQGPGSAVLDEVGLAFGVPEGGRRRRASSR
jgi:RNA polymerase sigma factor for flagellar operon FliA